jgi:hypothetical protein
LALAAALTVMLAGCADVLNAPPAAVVIPASFTNRSCRQVALARADDASVNGYDAAVRRRVASDSYAQCMELENRRAGFAAAP